MNLRNFYLSILIIVLSTIFSSCYYGNEEDLFGPIICNTEEMSFSRDIMPIFNNSCNSCHASNQAQGGIILDTYEDVLPHILNGKLIGSVKREPGFIEMPPLLAPLTDCRIEQLESWINNAAPNN